MTITIELVYGDATQQVLQSFTLEENQTIRTIVESVMPITETMQVGVWGEIKPWDYVLQAGDRIEIYRPLLIDPKLARRARGVAERKTRRRHRNIRGFDKKSG